MKRRLIQFEIITLLEKEKHSDGLYQWQICAILNIEHTGAVSTALKSLAKKQVVHADRNKKYYHNKYDIKPIVTKINKLNTLKEKD